MTPLQRAILSGDLPWFKDETLPVVCDVEKGGVLGDETPHLVSKPKFDRVAHMAWVREQKKVKK